MKFPNFIILGAPRTGTTSLYHYLRQHPQIYMSPVKEPQFFALGEMDLNCFRGPLADQMHKIVTSSRDDYFALFRDVGEQIAVGEASMTNLLPRAAERIAEYLPDAKLIVILRQPAERAWSHFLHARWMGWEPLASFEDALQQEEERLRNHWTPFVRYKERGFYARLLQPYLRHFDRRHLRVYWYEAWRSKPDAVLYDLFDFLGVDANFQVNHARHYNVSRTAKSAQLHQLLHGQPVPLHWLHNLIPAAIRRRIKARLYHYNQNAPPPLQPEIRHRLTKEYREDIGQLAEILNVDLSHWL